jgi:putative hydrolase of the HAD superfamily
VILEDTHHSEHDICSVEVILFDFGGVLAEEGFRKGLRKIAAQSGLEPESFVQTGFELVFEVGYVLGEAGEATFWDALRRKTGIGGSDASLRAVILDCFEIRSWMLNLIKGLRQGQVRLAILSDQTNWLDELNVQNGFFDLFEHVFNSFYEGKSKRDPTLFDDVLKYMQVQAGQVLFVDDSRGNIGRAKEKGLHTILYESRRQFESELRSFCPSLKF